MLYPYSTPSRTVLDLSGLWDFQPDPDEAGEEKGFMHRLPAPRPLAVPGSWNEQYADLFGYFGPAWHLRRFVMPADWKGRRVLLRVGSANYRAVVWVNGRRVGEHEGGHLPFVCDITAAARFGDENVLAIMVENTLRPDRVPAGNLNSLDIELTQGYPDTSFDFYPYAGLHRPVVLYCVPPAHIQDITVITRREGGQAYVQVTVRMNDAPARGQVRLVGGESSATGEMRSSDAVGQVELRLSNTRWWSPDDPFLYNLTVVAGQDVYAMPVGLRTVAVQGKQFLLNDAPVWFKGFGRHEDFCASGRGLNLPLLVKDYDLLRWVGANSYRTSHYPYSEEEMQMADRLGILIIDELPAVSFLFDDQAGVEKRKATCLRMLEALIARDKNHAAVVMWSVANEPLLPNLIARLSGQDTTPPPAYAHDFFRDLIVRARALDPTRPVTFVGRMGAPLEWQALTDVICVNRYWGWHEQGGQLARAIETLDQELDLIFETFQKPILISEFGADAPSGLHSQPPVMWSEEYQAELIRGYVTTARRKDFVIGAHVWNFADFLSVQSTRRVGGLNQKGVFTRDRRPKLAAHVLRELWRDEPSSTSATAAPEVVASAAAVPPATSQAVAQPASALRAMLEAVARRIDGARPGLTTTLKFDFGSDGVYRFVIRDGRVSVVEGDGEAVAWVRMAGDMALKVFRDKVNPMAAVLTGRIKVGGDLKALTILRDF